MESRSAAKHEALVLTFNEACRRFPHNNLCFTEHWRRVSLRGNRTECDAEPRRTSADWRSHSRAVKSPPAGINCRSLRGLRERQIIPAAHFDARLSTPASRRLPLPASARWPASSLPLRLSLRRSARTREERVFSRLKPRTGLHPSVWLRNALVWEHSTAYSGRDFSATHLIAVGGGQ